MADFRKWIPVLAVIALLLGGAFSASAQGVGTPFNCTVQQAVATQVRAEGLAELVGDVLIACQGGTTTAAGAVIPQVNVQVFLNTNITSKQTGANGLTEALLLIDEPQPGEQVLCNSTGASQGSPCLLSGTGGLSNPYKGSGIHPGETKARANENVFQGTSVAANSILWPGVPIDPPGTTTFSRYIRITNVRANANQLGVSSTLIPASIIMFISTTPNTSMPITNPTQTVAFIQSGLVFSVATPSSPPLSLNQCTNVNNALAGDATTTASTSFNLLLSFKEGFNTAFKLRIDSSGVQAVPGQQYPGSESGLYNPSVWPSTTASFATGTNSYSGAGLASQGTRVMAVFTGIPNGVQLFAGVTGILTSGTKGPAATAGTTADLVSVTDPTGSTPYTTLPATKSDVGSPTFAVGIVPVPVTAGSAWATYELTGVNTTGIDNLVVGFVIAYTSNTAASLPAVGTASVGGSFAPTSTVTTSSTSAPVPRFADTSSLNTTAVFTISTCVTDILFPFVTNQSGFDTGIAIANTSTDPFATTAQSGTCALYYYGSTTGGGAAPATQTTGTVASGSVLVFSLSTGGTGVAATPGFQGYMIATCQFQFAHAFAFISDLGAQKLAQGYLGLILDTGNLNRGSSPSLNTVSAESRGN